MFDLMTEPVSTDRKCVGTLSASSILLRAGLKVERTSAAEFEKLSKEIDEQFDSVKADYELRMWSIAESKADLELRYQTLLQTRKRDRDSSFDMHIEHAKHCELAEAGDDGIGFVMALHERGGTISKDEVVAELGAAFEVLSVLMHLGAAGVVKADGSTVRLTENGLKLAEKLTRLAE